MKAGELIKQLEREQKILTSQLEAIDMALSGLQDYKKALNGAGTVPRTPEQEKGTNKKPKRKRAARPRTEQCEWCGKMYTPQGITQHRKGHINSNEPMPIGGVRI